jgi:hypothetical protein
MNETAPVPSLQRYASRLVTNANLLRPISVPSAKQPSFGRPRCSEFNALISRGHGPGLTRNRVRRATMAMESSGFGPETLPKTPPRSLLPKMPPSTYTATPYSPPYPQLLPSPTPSIKSFSPANRGRLSFLLTPAMYRLRSPTEQHYRELW